MLLGYTWLYIPHILHQIKKERKKGMPNKSKNTSTKYYFFTILLF